MVVLSLAVYAEKAVSYMRETFIDKRIRNADNWCNLFVFCRQRGSYGTMRPVRSLAAL